MKHLPVGRQNFEGIIRENLLYVDKTRQVHKLIKSGSLYFFSRPRRFGKSLLISTFRHLFSGKKELFKDLYISRQTDYAFEKYPVLQFNLASFGHKVENLEDELSNVIEQYALENKVDIVTTSISTKLKTLIQNISKKGAPVVLLIDEYDKPIIDFITEIKKAQRNQKILRDFFSPLKELDAQGHLRFLFITGVSKFSKVSLFSDLNNLTDLTIHSLSHDLLGITQKELVANFKEYIEVITQKFKMPEEDILKVIKNWYNGYSFDGEIRLYNPFSLLHFFLNKHFGNYWFATGTPTFLVNTIRDRGINPREFENKEVDEAFLMRFSLEDLNMTGLLFQTGYLTIRRIESDIYETRYFLDYPNLEVRKSMMRHLVEAFTFTPSSTASETLLKMQRGLRTGDLEMFVQQLTIILSNIKYNWQPPKQYKTEAELFRMWEGYFHAILYLITSHMEMYVQAEMAHQKGRLDLIAETKDFLYLMEFKLDEPVENAIAQIKTRQYALPYLNSPKTVFLVGINFSKEERNVESWEAEEWKRPN
ncbi:MAG: AAA family ATPase [Bacteroidetes bacterium]|nr:AAA family ATPase [Bacteroidota bacterium]